MSLASAALVFGGGALGSALRYLVMAALAPRFGRHAWCALLVVNLTGCIAIGALSGDGGSRLGLLVGLGASDARWTFSVGLLGGYTSFSAISVFSERLWMEGRRATALAQALLPVLAAIPGVRCGAALVAWLAPGGAA